MYKLCYLPLAEKDLNAITDYIADTLNAPQAAADFLEAVEDGINQLREHPYSRRIYQPLISTDLEYRVLVVKNYLVFYVVLDGIIEIHRVIYSRRDLSQVIK